jgi:hypothetical protein
MDAELFRFSSARRRSPEVEAWLRAHPAASPWFALLRSCGDDVRECMHDGFPTACVDDSAFAHVAQYKAHISIYFFFGALLDDPSELLEGTGKRGRHVKIRSEPDTAAVSRLIETAYLDMRSRLHK